LTTVITSGLYVVSSDSWKIQGSRTQTSMRERERERENDKNEIKLKGKKKKGLLNHGCRSPALLSWFTKTQTSQHQATGLVQFCEL